MIVGIDASRANKPQKTGVEWYSHHLIRELVRRPSRHTYRLYFRDEPEPSLANLGPDVEYRILRWPFKYLWTQLRLSLEMLLNPPDLLFIPAQIIPLIHPSRTVTTIHDVAFKPYPESYSWQSRRYLDLAALLAKRLPLVITISEFSKKEIMRYYNIPASKISVIPLGFSSDAMRRAGMAETKYDVRDPYILYIGRLERKKNITVLIESFSRIKEAAWGKRFQLALVGVAGHGWEQIERSLQRSPYRDDIKVIGWVTEEEKHTLLQNARALVLLSAYEGFGLPLLEAMGAATPIIASNQASIPEIAGDAALLVERGNAAAVRDALHAILTDQNRRNALIEAGKHRVQGFSWKKTADMTAAAFDILLRA